MAEQFQSEPKTKPRLPMWAKATILVVLLGFAGSTAGIFGAIYTVADKVKKAGQPAYIASVVNSIADIELPRGYKYVMAVEAFTSKIVVIVYEADKTAFMLGAFPAPDPKYQSSGEVIREIADRGIPGMAERFQVNRSGEEKVAGKTMNYLIGKSVDRDGSELNGMLGGVLLPESKKLVLLYGWASSGEFDFADAQRLIAAIKTLH